MISVAKTMLKLLVLPFALSMPSISFANGTQTGYVVKLAYANGGQVFIYLSGSPSGQPSCATQSRFSVNANTDVGKAMIQQAISLYNNRQQALIQGTGTCSIWSDTEDVQVLWTPNY